jgi:hypothetical protein
MNEHMPTSPTPEELKLKERQEEDERCAQFEKDHPELFKVTEAKRDSGPEIVSLEGMIASFEVTYSLEELHAIDVLMPKDAPSHPLRQPAKIALEPIVALMNVLKEETDISAENYAALRAQYKRLSQAVGMINGITGKVDHTR